MNLLIDVSLNQLHHKIGSKHASCKQQKDSDLNDLTIYQLLEILGDGNCAYTGKPFTDLQNATFERVNPERGYLKGNVLMVSKEANGHKAQLDCFIKTNIIPDAMKVKLMRKAIYQLEKRMKEVV